MKKREKQREKMDHRQIMAHWWQLSSGESVEYGAAMVMDLQGEREKWVIRRKMKGE